MDQVMDIFNSAPKGQSSYNSDGECTCGCSGKPPCEDISQKALKDPWSIAVASNTIKQGAKLALGPLIGGSATFVLAMFFPSHDAGAGSSMWSSGDQQRLNDLSFKESLGNLSDNERRELWDLLDRRLSGGIRPTMELEFANSPAEWMNNKDRYVPVHILEMAIRYGQKGKDPKGSPYPMYYIQMSRWKPKGYQTYNLEVLYNPNQNKILHYVYKRDAMGPLPAIK